MSIATVIINFVLSVFFINIYENTYGNENKANAKMSAITNQTSRFADNPVDLTFAADKTIHAVVHIKTEYREKNEYYDMFFGLDPFFRDLFPNLNPQRRNTPLLKASGSGVILTSDGYIVTNNHVVDGAENIEVVLNDKRTFKAKLIGNDPTTDLALLKIDAKDLPFITYGNSDDVRIGEWVLAVGNPFNLTSTVTAGIVSAKARNINILNDPSAIESFIQTDAAVNPGNSGGALVNTKGELIGVNAAIASNTGSYTGYSFAIPVNIVKKVVGDLIEYGEVQRAYLGVSIRNIDAEFAKERNIKDLKGVYVDALTESGSAKDNGILVGDIINKIDGVEVNSNAELLEQIGKHRPGDHVTLFISRGDKTIEIPIQLRNKFGEISTLKNDNQEKITLLGATFENAPKDELKNLYLDYGVKITKLNNGILKTAGIKQGLIITAIDKKEVRKVSDVQDMLRAKRGGIMIEGVYPNGVRAYYAFGL
jgi:Do/DeqQ family serine protease